MRQEIFFVGENELDQWIMEGQLGEYDYPDENGVYRFYDETFYEMKMKLTGKLEDFLFPRYGDNNVYVNFDSGPGYQFVCECTVSVFRKDFLADITRFLYRDAAEYAVILAYYNIMQFPESVKIRYPYLGRVAVSLNKVVLVDALRESWRAIEE